MAFMRDLLLVVSYGVFFIDDGFGIQIDGNFASSLARIRRSAPGQPSLGYGGGVSYSLEVNPKNVKDPVNFADSVQFGYGINGAGVKQGNTVQSTDVIGNGKAGGNSFDGTGHGRGSGGGNANTAVAGSSGPGQAHTTDFAFNGAQGNGAGRGSATGQAKGG